MSAKCYSYQKFFLLSAAILLLLSSLTELQAAASKNKIISSKNRPVFANKIVRSGSGSIYQDIEKIINRYGNTANIGIYVQSISGGNTGSNGNWNNGDVIYQRNGQHLFAPASTLKIFTAAAALSFLGKDYVFNTHALVDSHARISNGKLYGNLYLKFEGDPTLTIGNLKELIASSLNALGANTIVGNVYIDVSTFDSSEFGPGWMWDERNFCYAAPVGAANLNHNCFPITVKTGGGSAQSEGGASASSPEIIQYNEYPYLQLVNKVNVISKSETITKVKDSVSFDAQTGDIEKMNEWSEDVAADNQEFVYDDAPSNLQGYGCSPLSLHGRDDNSYVLDGCMKRSKSVFNFLIAVRSTRYYVASVINDLLAKTSIKLDGKILFAKIDQQSKKVLLVKKLSSIPLYQMVKVMLKKSDNLIADAIYKKIGYHYIGDKGGATWKHGTFALQNILKKTGIDFRKTSIVDGCGLSRRNMISAKDLAYLLNYVYSNNKIRDDFWNALPISGVDDHLAGRMGNIKNMVHAKTGTMKGIAALAGYLKTNNGKLLSFAIIINDFVESVRKYQRLEDEICTLLVNIPL